MIITTDKILRPRDEHDHYPTPAPFVRAALGMLPAAFIPRDMCDPGAGSGVWGEVAWRKWMGVEIVGYELREVTPAPQYDEWYTGDFLDVHAFVPFDLIAGNPPYKHAEAFVRHSLSLLAPGGYLVQLLRLAFLEGQARGAGLWREFPPLKVGVCSARPSFTGNGKTDATAYAVFVWQQGYTGASALEWLQVAA